MTCFPTVLNLVTFQFSMNNGNNVRSLLMTSFAFAVVVGLMTPAYAQTLTMNQVEVICGDVDLKLVVDVTGSMEGAIGNIRDGLGTIVTQVENSQIPGSELRVGVFTYTDDVSVDFPLTTDIASVQTFLNGLVTAGGVGDSEATDMALQIAIAADGVLPAADANGDLDADTGGTSSGSDNVAWNPVGELAKSNVLVYTADNLAGGFNDINDGNDDANFAASGPAAAAKEIAILGLFASHLGSNPAMKTQMDALGQSNTFFPIDAVDIGDVGQDAAQSILDFLADPALCDICILNPDAPECKKIGGDFLPMDSTALLIAGMSANLSLIVPIVAGIAGVSAYYIKTRINKD